MDDHRAEDKSARNGGKRGNAQAYRPRMAARARARTADDERLRELQSENTVLRRDIERLQTALDQYRRAQEHTPFASLSLDRLGRIVVITDKAAALLGVEPERLVGKPLLQFIAGDSRNTYFMHLHACRSGRRAASSLLTLKHIPSGEVREVEMLSTPHPEQEGETLCHLVLLDSERVSPATLSFLDLETHKQFMNAVRSLEVQRVRLEAQNQQLRETQRLLEESRDRYAQLYEFSPVGYVSLNESGYVVVANLTASVMLDSDREHLIGQPLLRYVGNENRPRLRAHLEQCRAGMPLVKTELKLKTRQGEQDIELISVRPAEEGDGSFYRTVMMDITERKHAIEALRESEGKLRWLIDNMPAVMWIREEGGGARYVSANVLQVLGYEEHEVRAGGGRFWNDNVHPDDRERVQAAYARMFDTAESGGPAAYDIEYRRRTKDGDWVWVMDRGMSVGEDNGVRYATGMFSDTTRRKRMQEQLRESEERFRQLAENINDVFFLTDVRGSRIYYVSPTFQRVWGFSSDALYRDAASWIELVHEADRKRVQRVVRARRPDTPYDVEFRSRRPDGAVRWVRLRGFPIRDSSGNVLRVAGIASDITARKQAAESLQRSHQQMRALALHLQGAREEERKRIAREIHDELGALLLAIKMDAEACRKKGISANGEGAGILQQLVGRVDAAIDSVRRIATDLRPSILDNLGVLAAVEWEAQDVERRTGIKCMVEADVEKEEPDLAPEQATALFRIVQEALSNVVRHSGATRVKIVLREEAGGIKLQITDNGKGIDLERRPDSHQWGLVGMAERVSTFNGQIRIDRAKPRGTVVTAVIPGQPARELRPRL